MTYSVSVRISAKLEIAEAEDWYEAREPGLGLEFRTSVADAIGRIAEDPLLYPEIFRGNRRLVMRRFPYNIWFRMEGEHTVIIMAIVQGRRGVRHLRGRLSRR